MTTFKGYISDIMSEAGNVKDNFNEDVTKLKTIYDLIAEIVKECKKTVELNGEIETDSQIKQSLAEEYRVIVAQLKESDDKITYAEEEFTMVKRLVPKIDKHIKKGFLAFDEWEPPRWKRTTRNQP